MYFSDFNGQVNRNIDEFDGVHGWYVMHQRNLEGGMLQQFCLEKELYVSNIWFRARGKKVILTGRK